MRVEKTDPSSGAVRDSLISPAEQIHNEEILLREQVDEGIVRKVVEENLQSRNIFLATTLTEADDIRTLRIRFNPYSLKNERVSKVRTSESNNKEQKIFLLNVDLGLIPDSRVHKREEIILPFFNNEFLADVEKIAMSLSHDWQEANEKRKQYFDLKFGRTLNDSNPEVRLREFEYIRKNNLFFNTQSVFYPPDLATIKKAFKQKVDKLSLRGELDPDLLNNENAESLAVFFCLDTTLSPCGFLSRLPKGFLSVDSKTFTSEIQAVGRYVVPRLVLDEKNQLKKSISAKEAEEITDWTSCFSTVGLTTVGRFLPASDFLKVVYPGYLDSVYPPIREWKIPGAKWKFFGDEEKNEVKELLTRAVKCIFVENGGVNSDGTININTVLDQNWNEIFHREENGLVGALQRCNLVGNAFDLLELAVPEFFEVYPKHRFEYAGKWQGENRLKTIDSITRFLVEKKLKLVKESGEISPEKITWVRDWFNKYDDECGGCLKSAGLNAYDALKRAYPNRFGWHEGQIYPGEIKYDGMWEGASGKKLFQLRLAKSIYDVVLKLKRAQVLGFKNSEVKFSPDAICPLEMSRKDFISLRNAYFRGDITWSRHIQAAGLEGGFKSVPKTVNKAFELLFGKLNKKTREYGESGIYESDIFAFDSLKQTTMRRLIEDFNEEIPFATVKINGVMEGGYGGYETGIENCFLKRLLSSSVGDDYADKTKALYYGFVSSVQSGKSHQDSALERMLTASVKGEDDNERFLLSDKNLYMLLKMVRDDIVDNLNLDSRFKHRLKGVINHFTNLTTPIKDSREILITAFEVDKTSDKNNDLLTLMNTIFEHIFEVLTIHEIRQYRHFGSYSDFYEEAFSTLKEEREVEE